MPLKEMLVMLQERFGVPIRIDLAAFSRIGKPEVVTLYQQSVTLSARARHDSRRRPQ